MLFFFLRFACFFVLFFFDMQVSAWSNVPLFVLTFLFLILILLFVHILVPIPPPLFPHQVRVSTGLCVTCSNKRAAASGGRHLMMDPETGALMSAVAPPPVAAKNQALRKYLGQGEGPNAVDWGQKDNAEQEEKVP